MISTDEPNQDMPSQVWGPMPIEKPATAAERKALAPIYEAGAFHVTVEAFVALYRKRPSEAVRFAAAFAAVIRARVAAGRQQALPRA